MTLRAFSLWAVLFAVPALADFGFPDWVKFPPQVGLAEGQSLVLENLAEAEFFTAESTSAVQRGKHWARWLAYAPAKGEPALGYYNGSEARVWGAFEPVLERGRWTVVYANPEHTHLTLTQQREGKTYWATLKTTPPTGELRLELIEVGEAATAYVLAVPAKSPERFGDDDDVPWLAPFPGSKRINGGHASEPLDVSTPGEGGEPRLVGSGVVRRTYQGPSTLSALQFVQASRAALTKAGWKVLYPASAAKDRESGSLIAHYAKDTRDLWALLFFENGAQLSYSVTDVGSEDWAAKLEKECRLPVYGVFFDFDKAVIKPESDGALKKVLAVLKASTSQVEVQGHTDNKGSAEYNLKLSTARALAVKQWLAKAGIAAARLSSQGYGLTQPIADNGTDAGRAKNRRVELVRTGCTPGH